MTIIINLDRFLAPHPKEIFEYLSKTRDSTQSLPKAGRPIYSLRNEIRPADLYCYLRAKFGEPNGIQNLLRTDDSDNLIHWNWTLRDGPRLIDILGMNLRTEVHFLGKWDLEHVEIQQLIRWIKDDLPKFGRHMSDIRKSLEDWERLENPYARLKQGLNSMTEELKKLAVQPEVDATPDPSSSTEFEGFRNHYGSMCQKYEKAYGLCASLRVMTPIIAEAFVNLILFVLLKKDIKANDRLLNAIIRSNIDIKVQSLHLNCIGFSVPVDWQNKACSAYNSLVNERNDLLHGNIVPSKHKFGEIYFLGRIPIFREYESMWEQTLGRLIESSGYKNIFSNITVVENFCNYVLSCLEAGTKREMERFCSETEIGVNKNNGRMGILLPGHIADIQMVPVVH